MYYLIVDRNIEGCFIDEEPAHCCFTAAVSLFPNSNIILALEDSSGMKWDIMLVYNRKEKDCISYWGMEPPHCIHRVHKLIENLKNSVVFYGE